jgi:hypothetical protein
LSAPLVTVVAEVASATATSSTSATTLAAVVATGSVFAVVATAVLVLGFAIDFPLLLTVFGLVGLLLRLRVRGFSLGLRLDVGCALSLGDFSGICGWRSSSLLVCHD